MSISDLYKHEEIDLIACFKVLIKRWKTVLAVFLLSFAVIIGVLISLPHSYEASAVVRIGGFSRPLFSSAEVLYELQSQDYLKEAARTLGLGGTLFELKNMITAEPLAEDRLIKIRIQASSPKIAGRFCNWLADTFVADGNKIYKKEADLFKKRIRKLEVERLVSDQEKIFLLNKELIESTDFKVLSPAADHYRPVINKEKNKVIYWGFVVGIVVCILLVMVQESLVTSRKGHGSVKLK